MPVMVFTMVAMASAAPGESMPAAGRWFRYEEMSSEQLSRVIRQCPVAFLPAGIVEWHGEQSACGLDGLKAEALALMAAEQLGGVCFPHLWLGPPVSTPFDPTKYPRGTVTIEPLLYSSVVEQLLRQIEGMGFRVAVHLSGHYPGVVREVSEGFNRRGKMKVLSLSENLLVKEMPAGDHAATWETSLLSVLRPGLVDLNRLPPLPRGVEHPGEVIPPPWEFHQRCEYYGVYGSDPRLWANTHYGRCGVEAVIDGLAREIGKVLGDASYGRKEGQHALTWPDDTRQKPEVRYEYLLPSQWIERFERAPIVYLPIPDVGGPTDATVRCAITRARRAGGMVFPPLNYAPARETSTIRLSADVFRRVAEEIVRTLAEMNFRVVVLVPGPALTEEVRAALQTIRAADGQSRVITMPPSDDGTTPATLSTAIRDMIPMVPAVRRLDGEWRINGERTIRSLVEGVYGPAETRIYEHTFEMSEHQVAGAVLLDLGTVENHCEVVINDGPPLVDHWPPYRFLITGQVQAGRNKLKVTVRHKPQPTLDMWYYRIAPPRLVGPVNLVMWRP